MTSSAETPPSLPEEFKESLFAYMTRYAPDHVELIDRDFRVRYLNHPAPGTSVDDVIGKSLLDLSPPEEVDALRERMEQVFENRQTVRWQGMWDTPVGRRHYNVVAGPVLHDGEVAAAALIARDITDLVNLQLQQANTSRLATVGELAAGVGHEINNPLMALTGHLISVQDALDDAGIVDKVVHDKLRECEDSVSRIARIVRGLRRFSRSGKSSDVFDVNRSIEETTEFLAGIFGFRSISFELEFDEPNLNCVGDGAVFQQVLTNILTNAEHALRGIENPLVVIRTRRVDENVMIEVEDNGPGIADRVLPHIFDPFFSTKEADESSGLGLALCRSIIESMNGSIEAENRTNGGALFRVQLPHRMIKLAPLVDNLSWKDQKLQRGRVLVVDDDEAVLDAVSFLLEDLGFQVSSRSDPSEALRVIEEDRFDIVISDRQMPGMSGEIFVQQADQRLRRAGTEARPRYFLLSGWHDPNYDDNARVKLGDIDIGLIEKPVTRAELANHLSTRPRP